MQREKRIKKSRKDINFRPTEEFLNQAKEDFLKNGGKIRKIDYFGFDKFINRYRSGLETGGVEEMPIDFM